MSSSAHDVAPDLAVAAALCNMAAQPVLAHPHHHRSEGSRARVGPHANPQTLAHAAAAARFQHAAVGSIAASCLLHSPSGSHLADVAVEVTAAVAVATVAAAAAVAPVQEA
eukprot:scaffold269816_cov16-Tisochrysis_lutea.AAC.1